MSRHFLGLRILGNLIYSEVWAIGLQFVIFISKTRLRDWSFKLQEYFGDPPLETFFWRLDLLRMSASASVGVLACPLMPLMPDEWQQRHSIHPKGGALGAGKGATSLHWAVFLFHQDCYKSAVVIGMFHWKPTSSIPRKELLSRLLKRFQVTSHGTAEALQ